MELRRYRAPLTIMLLSIAIFSVAIAFIPRGGKTPANPGTFAFPQGIPLAFDAVSTAQADEQPFDTISVTGSGTASIQADEATVTLGVQTQKESASAVIDAIKALGITKEDMRTVSYNVFPCMRVMTTPG